MSLSQRIFIALIIVVIDFVFFVMPLGSLLLAYVVIARPPAFRDWVLRVYGS